MWKLAGSISGRVWCALSVFRLFYIWEGELFSASSVTELLSMGMSATLPQSGTCVLLELTLVIISFSRPFHILSFISQKSPASLLTLLHTQACTFQCLSEVMCVFAAYSKAVCTSI